MTPTTTPMAAWLESAWLARYLDRQLSGDEAAWFEAYLLDKPELLGMVEVDSALRDTIVTTPGTRQGSPNNSVVQHQGMDVSPSHTVEPRTDSGAGSASTSANHELLHSARRRSRGMQRWAGVAASLVLGLGLGWLGERTLLPQSRWPATIANPTHVVYDTMRGEAMAPLIENANSSAAYTLFEVSLPLKATDVTLQISGESPMPLFVAPDGFVSFLRSDLAASSTTKAHIDFVLAGKPQSMTVNLASKSKEKW